MPETVLHGHEVVNVDLSRTYSIKYKLRYEADYSHFSIPSGIGEV